MRATFPRGNVRRYRLPPRRDFGALPFSRTASTWRRSAARTGPRHGRSPHLSRFPRTCFSGRWERCSSHLTKRRLPTSTRSAGPRFTTWPGIGRPSWLLTPRRGLGQRRRAHGRGRAEVTMLHVCTGWCHGTSRPTDERSWPLRSLEAHARIRRHSTWIVGSRFQSKRCRRTCARPVPPRARVSGGSCSRCT